MLWHFLHFFVLVKSQCQSETVSMVTFYNWIKFVSKKLSGNGDVVSLIITFISYKHNYNQNPLSIVLNRHPKACPIQSFLHYVSVHGIVHGPLFSGAP